MKRKSAMLALFIISFIPLLALFHPGLPLTHDGPDHVARIANFYQAISEGILIPRWAANLNWGYGHPILMFLYPLPSYVASLFHGIGFSLVDSTKLVFDFSFVASIFAMFLWLDASFGIIPGFVGALLYGFAPYRFVDLYVRGAIGEHMAFVFPPLILYGLLRLSRRSRGEASDLLIIALSTAGLVLAHNAISLMFMPLVGLYILYLWLFGAKKQSMFIIVSFFCLFLGFLLAGFFWIPAFFEGKYTLRDIVTRGTVTQNFSPWRDFFFMPWSWGGTNLLSKEIGFVQWAGIAGSAVIMIQRRQKPIAWLIGFGITVLAVSLFLMTSSSSVIWETITLLQKFQFPWRLLSITTFVSAVLGAVAVSFMPKRVMIWIAGVACVALLATTYFMWRPSAFINKNEGYYSGIYNSTTDTGESSPIWSVRFMEHRPTAAMEIIEGKGEITSIRRLTTKHVYQVSVSVPSRILENTLYFPGWSIRVDGNQVPIEFQDPQYRGLMTFHVDPGTHSVVVSFEDTKLRRFADALSIVGLLLLVGLAGWTRKV